MTRSDAVAGGREAFEGRAWEDARARLSAADREEPLAPEDLERLATAAFLVGHDAESEEVWARAHHALLDRGDDVRAARCALRLAFQLLTHGESARGGGWVARAKRILDDVERDCVERGYLLFPAALRAIFAGENEEACSGSARGAAPAPYWSARSTSASGGSDRLTRTCRRRPGHSLRRLRIFTSEPARNVRPEGLRPSHPRRSPI